MPFPTIKGPTLIIDETKARNNIQQMAEKASRNRIPLRPHFKTHHSKDVGNWFRDYGVETITCSSVSMAMYFANNGWHDITVAFPYNPYELNDIQGLASRIKLNILIESEEAVQDLEKNFTGHLGYFIKLDVGTHRTGVDTRDIEKIHSLMKSPSRKLEFKGFLAHAGHSYQARSQSEMDGVLHQVKHDLKELREAVGTDVPISYGDTPTCSMCEDLSFFSEIRCGNFVYYDVMQSNIGSCNPEDIAVAVACPVVATHPERNEALVYGGAVHFSKDFVEINGQKVFGQVVRFGDDRWKIIPDLYLSRISQEHGILKGPDTEITKIKFGDMIGILPAHSCLTADLLSSQFTLDGTPIRKMPR